MSKFQVWVTTTGDNGSWSTNAVEHDTLEEAKQAGSDLFMRWFAVEKWAVLEAGLYEGHISEREIVIHAEYQNW